MKLGQGLSMANLLQGNDYVPSQFFSTSVNEVQETTESTCISRRDSVQKILKKCNVSMETSNLTQDNIEFINNHLNLTLEEVKSLEAKTTEQSNSDIWFLERNKHQTLVVL